MSPLIQRAPLAIYTEGRERRLKASLPSETPHRDDTMDTNLSSTVRTAPPQDDTLYVTNPLRASLALVLGGSLSGHISEDGGKMLTFKIKGAPDNFIQDHEAGRLCVPTDAIEQKFGFISGVIREHSRGLEARARANRALLNAAQPGNVSLPARSR